MKKNKHEVHVLRGRVYVIPGGPLTPRAAEQLALEIMRASARAQAVNDAKKLFARRPV